MTGGWFDSHLEASWIPMPGAGAAQNYLDGNLADAFNYLGHAAHLLQDMTVPAHVHNDMHVSGDPFEDWVGGEAILNRPAESRWANYGLPAGLDYPVESPQDVAARSGHTFQPGYTPGSFFAPPVADTQNLLDLFLFTALRTDDFDSKDFFGQYDRGGRNGVTRQSPTDLGGENRGDDAHWTQQAVDTLARELVPTAIERTAELVRHFFGLVDTEDPRMAVTFGGHADAGQSPQVVRQATFRVTVGATDQDTGDSGISRHNLTVRYRQMAPGGSWTPWQCLPDLPTDSEGASLLDAVHVSDLSSFGFPGQHGAKAEYRFQGQPWYSYAFEVAAEDGAGNITTQEYQVNVEPYQVNVVEVIDASGSMGDEGKLQAAQQAAAMFVDLMETNGRIGVVSYSTSGGVAYPLTRITDSGAERQGAMAAIQGISASGNTSIGAGFAPRMCSSTSTLTNLCGP